MLIYSKSEEKCPNTISTIIMFLFPVIWEFFHKSLMRVWTQRRSLHLSKIKLCSLKVKVWFQMPLCRQTERRSSCSLAATSSGSVLFATKCSFVSSVTAARPRGVEPAPAEPGSGSRWAVCQLPQGGGFESLPSLFARLLLIPLLHHISSIYETSSHFLSKLSW